MAWFNRSKPGILNINKKEVKDGLWIKCEKCSEIIYKKQLIENAFVCMKCDFHFRMNGDQYIQLILDDGQFEELDADIESTDFLNFKDTVKYNDRLKTAMKKTGLKDAIRTGKGKISGTDVIFGVMDFSFIGGSMGSVVGEKTARAIDYAWQTKKPLIIVCASGGARMQESILSLMQMAKTASRLARFSDAGGLYIPVLTNPTTAGVVASFAMLGDLHLAEPDALIGFAGPRVIKQTIGQDLPDGFQRSQFQKEHGFVDKIVHRKDLKNTLHLIFKFCFNSRDTAIENE